MAQATGLLGFKTVENRSENELYLFAAVDNARFKQPVVPGDTMHLHVKFLKSVVTYGNLRLKLKLTAKQCVAPKSCVLEESFNCDPCYGNNRTGCKTW